MKIILIILALFSAVFLSKAMPPPVVCTPISASSTIVNTSCGGSVGSITITNVTGGGGTVSPPVYQYSIDNATWQLGNTFTGLMAAPYTVYIRDKNTHTCTTSISVIINDNPLSGTAIPSPVTGCFGNSNGSITVNASGGSETFQYSLTGNAGSWVNSGEFSGLTAGDYTKIQIRDLNNKTCTYTCSPVTVNQPSALSATVTKIDMTCSNNADGK